MTHQLGQPIENAQTGNVSGNVADVFNVHIFDRNIAGQQVDAGLPVNNWPTLKLMIGKT